MDTYLKNESVYVENEGEPLNLNRDEYEYHWALSDIAGFVVKYGIDFVLKDIMEYIDAREQRPNE